MPVGYDIFGVGSIVTSGRSEDKRFGSFRTGIREKGCPGFVEITNNKESLCQTIDARHLISNPVMFLLVS